MRPASLLPCLIALAFASSAGADGFTLESASFGPNATLDTKYVFNGGSCRGGDNSPELHWSGAPEGTKSFAVTLFDPDARNGAGFWHWIVFDINAKTTSLPVGAGADAGSVAPPGSVSGKNDFDRIGYSGPCPPKGDKPHRYVFTVYALRTEHLGIPAGADGPTARKALEADAILSATLQAQYGR
ncbi:MAG TPA: YbhB/YbcL family Raf kinase inhibitor-like protein [Rhodanobacteraceae bacterium]|jgi:Raf kinase inhibitor-like YbhB/YbcL family protein|nr:YbhB/YbcL family Raf kinase inhibitor-like protein [Rhodanobacteraceae bacterium]